MDVLAVRSDRRRIDRLLGTATLAILAPVLLSLVFAVYFVAQGASYAIAVFAIPLVGLLPLAIAQGTVWASTRRIAYPLEVGPLGMVFDTPRGRVAFPWEAVTGVALLRSAMGTRLVVQLHPQAGPGAPGVTGDLTRGGWRLVRRQGFQLSMRVVLISPEELGQAVEHYSRGRFRPLLPA